LYVTSSRNPSLETRRFCKLFSFLIPRGAFEPRGAKTVEKVCARARKLGKMRALIVSEKHSLPAALSFLETDAEWNWLEPKIELKKITWKKIPGKGESPENAAVEGGAAGKVSGLFDFAPVECEEDVLLVNAEGDSLSFAFNGKEMLLMNVAYTHINEKREGA